MAQRSCARVKGGAAVLRQGEGYRVEGDAAELRKGVLMHSRALQATLGHSGAVPGRGARGVNY